MVTEGQKTVGGKVAQWVGLRVVLEVNLEVTRELFLGMYVLHFFTSWIGLLFLCEFCRKKVTSFMEKK